MSGRLKTGDLFAADRGRVLLLVMAAGVCAAPVAGFAAVCLWGDVNGRSEAAHECGS
jgi:hypothetical protein